MGIIRYLKQPSIRKIRSFAHNNDLFYVRKKVSLEQIHNEVGRPSPNMATTFELYLQKVLRSSFGICYESKQLNSNECVLTMMFHDAFKRPMDK